MASIWVESLARGFEQALELLAAAVRDCPDDLWQASMWDVPPLPREHQFVGADWQPITDASQREDLAARWTERFSAPWSVAWHALETLDYDLTGEFAPWMPPPPFFGHPHWRDLPSLPAAWRHSEVLGYVEYCRERVRTSLGEMTDEKAARPLPPAHRYSGQPHADIIVGMVVHTAEHASQIRQFVTARGTAANV